MNRRNLFKNVALLAGASVVAPELLADALPREYSASIPLEAILSVNVYPILWPTYEEILAQLAREYRNMFVDADLSYDTANYQILCVIADHAFAHQEMMRRMLASRTPVAYELKSAKGII